MVNIKTDSVQHKPHLFYQAQGLKKIKTLEVTDYLV